MTHLPPPPDPVRAERMAAALHGAAERGELSLVYQPQVCLDSGEIVGVEALLRWHWPEEGPVSPEEFIPQAEAGGSISAIGTWVLHQACAQAAAWRDQGLPEVRVGVNVSPQQFRGMDLAAEVRLVLAACRLPASALGIEVTESTLIDDTDRVAQTLRALQSEGVEISLDDFGTGYSSLSRLRQLPIDVVKIDRSFVCDVTAARTSASVTRSVIHLAHGLNLRVLAEGVENHQQLQMLVDNGCDRIQGWVFGKGVAAEEVADLLRNGRKLPIELTHRRERQGTLLLVDDEEHILSALKRLFRREGYRILTASTGAQALEVLATETVDVVVSDYRMPAMTGVELLRKVKDLYPDTVRLTLSGYTDLQSIIDAVNEGAVYKFLTKPWDDDRLRLHVAQAFRQRELGEENRRLSHAVTRANLDLAQANRRLEGLFKEERGRVQMMQAAVGGARDLIDLMPVIVLGVDADGLLAYANRRAFEGVPDWVACLGGPAESELVALVEALEPGAVSADEAGKTVHLQGQAYRAWVRRLEGEGGFQGQVLMLLPEAGAAAPHGEPLLAVEAAP